MDKEPKFALELMGKSEGLEAWDLEDLWADPMGTVVIVARRATDGASLEVRIEPTGTDRQALIDTPMGKVSHGDLEGLTPEEAGDIVRLVAKRLVEGKLQIPLHFPHLAIANSTQKDRTETQKLLGSIVQAQQKLLPDLMHRTSGEIQRSEKNELFFDPPGLAEFLEPDVQIDGPPIAGFILRSISLPAVARRGTQNFNQYILAFEHSHEDLLVQINVAIQESLSTEFGNAQSFSVNLKSSGAQADLRIEPQLATLCSWVLALLELKQGPGLKIIQPKSVTELRAISVPAATAPVADISTSPDGPDIEHHVAQILNLAFDAECNQECTFCSVKSFLPPSDEGDLELERARNQLRTASAEGIRHLRLNGINPLNFSRVLDVLDAAKEFGFTELTVYSPSRRFADAGFRQAFLERCPDDLHIMVPLYGVTPEVHDSVTGAPGSHSEVMAGFEGLLQDLGSEHLMLSTVVVQQNVHELADLSAYATSKEVEHYGLLSYPMRQTTRDPYAESSIRSIQVVQDFADQLMEKRMDLQSRPYYFLRTIINHPCVLFQQQKERKLPLFSITDQERATILEGTGNREREEIQHGSGGDASNESFSVATTPCPHFDSCALASICPGEHYAVYEQQYGLSEFQPVSVFDLYKTRPHPDWRVPN